MDSQELLGLRACPVPRNLLARRRIAQIKAYSGSFKSAEGNSKEPMVPIIGRMVGKWSSESEELKEMWRTGVSLMIEWMVARS